jgi:hypothetical protein
LCNIEQLRGQLAFLKPRAQGFDVFATVMGIVAPSAAAAGQRVIASSSWSRKFPAGSMSCRLAGLSRPDSCGLERSHVGPKPDRQTFQNSPGDGKDYPETELLVYTFRGYAYCMFVTGAFER